VAETHPRLAWPRQLIALLCEANEATCMARAAGLNALPGPMSEDLFNRYDASSASASRSSRTKARGSKSTAFASSRSTRCLRRFAAFFCGSYARAVASRMHVQHVHASQDGQSAGIESANTGAVRRVATTRWRIGLECRIALLASARVQDASDAVRRLTASTD